MSEDPSSDAIGFRPAEFIHLISSEANEICEQDSKKTIAPEHIIGALRVRLLCYPILFSQVLNALLLRSASVSSHSRRRSKRC